MPMVMALLEIANFNNIEYPNLLFQIHSHAAHDSLWMT